MSKKIKKVSLPVAIKAVLKDSSLAIRPAYWNGTGEALIHHAGNFYRMPMGEVGAPYSLSASDAVNRWEIVSQGVVTEEALNPSPMPESPDAGKKRRGRKPRDPNAPAKAKNPGGRRGRPAASEVAAAHPGWAGITDAAAECGLNAQKVRKAISDGRLATIKDRSCVLVEVAKLREIAATMPVSNRGRKPKAGTAPADNGVLIEAPSVEASYA